MNEVKRILNFWKEVNLLTPVTIKSIAFKNQESLSVKDILKVPYNRIEDSLLLNNDKKYEIEIGFGDIKNTYLYEKLKKKILLMAMGENLLFLLLKLMEIKNTKKSLLPFLNLLIFFLKILSQKTIMILNMK